MILHCSGALCEPLPFHLNRRIHVPTHSSCGTGYTILQSMSSWGGIHEKSQESCTSGQVFDILHSVRYDHKDSEKDRKQRVSALWRPVCNKSNMAANGSDPCNGFAPICRKTLCDTTITKFPDVRNPFLRSILCF